MIYTSARYANADHTLVTGTDALGDTETVPLDHTQFRQPEHGPQGFLANDWRFAPYFQRSHPLLNDEDVLAAADLTPEQVDGLWSVASTLPE